MSFSDCLLWRSEKLTLPVSRQSVGTYRLYRGENVLADHDAAFCERFVRSAVHSCNSDTFAI